MENQDFLEIYKFTENTKRYVTDNQEFKEQLEEFNNNKKISDDLYNRIQKIEDKQVQTEITIYITAKILGECLSFKNNEQIPQFEKEKESGLLKLFDLNNKKESEDDSEFISDRMDCFFNKVCEEKDVGDFLEKMEKAFDEICQENNIGSEEDAFNFINNALTQAGLNEINQNIFNIGGNNSQEGFASIGQNKNIDNIDEKESKNEKEENKEKNKDKDKNKSKSTSSKPSKPFDAKKSSENIFEALKTTQYLGLGGICVAIGAGCPIFYLFALFYFATATLGPKEMNGYLNSKNPIIKCLARISAVPNILLSSTKRILLPGSGKAKDGFSMLGNFLIGEDMNIDYHKDGLTTKIANKISGNKTEKKEKNNNPMDMFSQMMSDNGNQSKKEEIDKQIAKVHEGVNDGHISEQDMKDMNELTQDENLKNMTPEQLQQAQEDIKTCAETLEKQVQSDDPLTSIITPKESEPLQGLENSNRQNIISKHNTQPKTTYAKKINEQRSGADIQDNSVKKKGIIYDK